MHICTSILKIVLTLNQLYNVSSKSNNCFPLRNKINKYLHERTSKELRKHRFSLNNKRKTAFRFESLFLHLNFFVRFCSIQYINVIDKRYAAVFVSLVNEEEFKFCPSVIRVCKYTKLKYASYWSFISMRLMRVLKFGKYTFLRQSIHVKMYSVNVAQAYNKI